VFFFLEGPAVRVDVSQGLDSGAGCERADLNGWAVWEAGADASCECEVAGVSWACIPDVVEAA
jgi:hypothetical protein